ncbi:50S ribosomal protein L18 [Buchnera aphidicola (Mollitrichosiphum nigrofasciatum)]|uniref:50S ribosomal protein L18 n=1 Tax=Buchnera aphidicola TaxID=9 RepID=UPI0031B80CEA
MNQAVINKKKKRLRRAVKIRQNFKKLNKTRLVVHRTSRHIYAQIISEKFNVIVCASTLEKKIIGNLKYTGNKTAAALIGNIIAQRALNKGVKKVSFDRSGFKYHGRIEVLANAARDAGLIF